jgi:hypothetical protein
MAKRFAYVSFGILCLVAAYQLGAERASADWDPNGQIVGVLAHNTVWTTSGEAWKFFTLPQGWTRQEENDLPVPASEIRRDSWSGIKGRFKRE